MSHWVIRWQNNLYQSWQTRQSPDGFWLLRWISWFYRGLSGVRRRLYAWGWLKPRRLPCRVLVVGNVLVGGVGKTPTVLAVVTTLKQMGWQVGILSRGYGRQTKGVLVVNPAIHQAHEVGDEPLLLAQRTGVPVAVGSRRYEAGQALLSTYPSLDMLICDDGLQHLDLYRDAAIVVFDERGLGNGHLLPAGWLREPWPIRGFWQPDVALLPALPPHTSDVIAFAQKQLRESIKNYKDNENKSSENSESNENNKEKRTEKNKKNENAFRSSPLQWITYYRQLTLLATCLDPQHPPTPLTHLPNPLVAVAGIARPDRFFLMVQEAGVVLHDRVALPDHADTATLTKTLQTIPHTILCTAKDAIKLQQLPMHLVHHVWWVDVEMQLEGGWQATLQQLIHRFE